MDAVGDEELRSMMKKSQEVSWNDKATVNNLKKKPNPNPAVRESSMRRSRIGYSTSQARSPRSFDTLVHRGDAETLAMLSVRSGRRFFFGEERSFCFSVRQSEMARQWKNTTPPCCAEPVNLVNFYEDFYFFNGSSLLHTQQQ